MTNDLAYFCGMSWPRSGHHLLVRILSTYFGDRFGYCEYYSPKDCCKKIPCDRTGAINLSKNHDRDSMFPILEGGKYLIQYRKFCQSVVSDYELYIRNKGKDSKNRFKKFAVKKVEIYQVFMTRWATAKATNATFVGIAYERLTSSPVEALEPVISLFAPGEPLDRAKLVFAIENAERITVKDGAERPEAKTGVRASRDVRSFRHYDEKFFAKLEERSWSAYETMANMPVVRPIPSLNSDPDSLGGAALIHGEAAKNLYVDVTGMLALSGVALTGIPRVQDFLTKQAISDPDQSVRIVLYDRKLGAYRSPTNREMLHLASVRSMESKQENRAEYIRPTLYSAFRRIRENPQLGREFDRYFSTIISGQRPGSLTSSMVKNTLRGYRYYRWFLGLSTRRHRSSESDKLDLGDGIVLMSDMSIFSSRFSASVSAIEHPAFICHDLIPWLHPEFVGDKRQAKRFVSHLTRLLQSGAHALCTSDTSRGMLRHFVSDIGNATVRIDRFPLPSTLYEIAKSLGRVSRLEPKQPFILYCSTIEIRKNHLLLAKVWKRANDNGVSLPKLVCVGKWGWGVDELRAYLNANPELSQHIEFVGPVTDGELIDLYRSASFGVVPSKIEGWGFGASECLDFKTPVIVSTAPALQEAVSGLMPAIDAEDEDAWYAQIRQLAESAESRNSLTQRIIDQYRPVTGHESWQTIKAALRSAA